MAKATEETPVTQKELLEKSVEAAGKLFQRSADIDRIRDDANRRMQLDDQLAAQSRNGETEPDAAT